jgi:RNA polymerase sigma factor (sigma-70 family)
MANAELAYTVRDAVLGSQVAWDELVERFSGLVWGIARAHGLDHADSSDVSQTVWLRLAEHLGRLRDPERVGGWLAVTARNESQRVARQRSHQVPVSDDHLVGLPDSSRNSPDHELLAAEEATVLWGAFERLPVPCRVLLRMLLSDPPPSYSIVSETLGMPVGSIGPRRARCLNHLRGEVEDSSADGGRLVVKDQRSHR